MRSLNQRDGSSMLLVPSFPSFQPFYGFDAGDAGDAGFQTWTSNCFLLEI